MLALLRRLLRSSHRDSEGAIADLDCGEERRKSAEALYYEVASKKLDFQFRTIELIETRASTMFTIGSTILPITAGLLTSGEGALGNSQVAKIALFLGFACYVMLAVCFVGSFVISKWDSRPDPPQWREITVDREEEEIQRWLGDACVDAYEANEKPIGRKATIIGIAIWFLASEAACLTVAVLAPLWPIW